MMPSLTKDQMVQTLLLAKSMQYGIYAPIVDKMTDDAVERMLRIIREHVPEEQQGKVRVVFGDVLRLEVLGVLLEAIQVQRHQAAPASKGKASKAHKGREITRRVSLLNRDENGARLTLKELRPLIAAERVRSGLSEDIDESTISRHLEGSFL